MFTKFLSRGVADMPLITVRKKRQVTLPKGLGETFKEGSQFEIVPTKDGGARLRPVKTMPAEQVYSPEVMKELLKLANEAKRGENSEGPFNSMDDFVRHLHKQAKAHDDNKKA